MPLKKINWGIIDAKVEEKLGLTGVAVPSLRVAICWIFEYLGYKRGQNHVLVPRYFSRCILNAINRYAFPVESLTEQTGAVLIVDHFGFRQNMEAIEKVISDKKLKYIEDSATGINYKEEARQNSLGRLIGFSKVLPILKGGFFISRDKDLIAFIKKKGQECNSALYSWFIFMILGWLRGKVEITEHSTLADLAYEVYLESPRDNRLLLSNFWRGLDMVDEYAKMTQERKELIRSLLGSKVIYHDADRIGYAVLMPPEDKEPEIRRIFDKNSFDSGILHFDINRNIFNPRYQEVFAIPLNPTIPMKQFNNLIKELSSI